jgi:hypothetical protein
MKPQNTRNIQKKKINPSVYSVYSVYSVVKKEIL